MKKTKSNFLKFISVLAVLLAVLCAFSACNNNGTDVESTPTPTVEATETPTTAPESTPTPTSAPTPTPIDPLLIPEGASANITYDIDTSVLGKEITNKVSTMNMWMFNMFWLDEAKDQPHDFFAKEYPFVETMQFMQATGGNADRDLFINPKNKNVLDDYYFDELIEACRNLVNQGVTPCIKTGNVPQKYSTVDTTGTFGVNLFPPDDYDVYYNYIKAIAQALVDEFGLEEVQTWSWGCYTEYENRDWFTINDNAEETLIAFCKIYDYTVAALQDVLGEEIDIGAHSMSCSEGLWDERSFIEHCANGTNYATGKTGTRLTYLAGSFYDSNPNSVTEDNLIRTINVLRDKAVSVGLTNLRYGIDEGRLLSGTVKGRNAWDLISRVVGQTYQGAYDARIIKQMIDNDIDYFAAWAYKSSSSVWEGLDTVSLHVAREFYKMVGSKEITAVKSGSEVSGGEVGATASYDPETGKIYIMAYNFGDKIYYDGREKLMFNVKLPEGCTSVKVTRSLVDDDANFFDEFEAFREEFDIPDNHFSQSPESAQVNDNLNDTLSRAFFEAKYDIFAEASKLIPTEGTAEVTDGTLSLYLDAAPQATVFYVIETK